MVQTDRKTKNPYQIKALLYNLYLWGSCRHKSWLLYNRVGSAPLSTFRYESLEALNSVYSGITKFIPTIHSILNAALKYDNMIPQSTCTCDLQIENAEPFLFKCPNFDV